MRKPSQLDLTKKPLHWQIHKGKEEQGIREIFCLPNTQARRQFISLLSFSLSLTHSFAISFSLSSSYSFFLSPSLTLRDCIHMLSRDRWGQHPTYSRHSEALTLVRKAPSADSRTRTRTQNMHTCVYQCDSLHAAGLGT